MAYVAKTLCLSDSYRLHSTLIAPSPPHTHFSSTMSSNELPLPHQYVCCRCTCRKKCRALIQGLYDLPPHEVERLLPAKGGSLEVAVLSVPHCPVDGRVDVNVTVYYLNKEPLFFEYNRQWYPTGEDSGLPCC